MIDLMQRDFTNNNIPKKLPIFYVYKLLSLLVLYT